MRHIAGSKQDFVAGVNLAVGSGAGLGTGPGAGLGAEGWVDVIMEFAPIVIGPSFEDITLGLDEVFDTTPPGACANLGEALAHE